MRSSGESCKDMETVASSAALPLTCEDVEPLLPLVADGAIMASSDPAVFAHLSRCVECQDSLARHDLITLGLECGRGTVCAVRSAAAWHYRLPWPAATAAGLAVALLGAWALQHAAGGSAPAPVLAQRADTQVISVPGPDPSRPYYVVVQGDHVSVIDPQAVDGSISRDSSAVHPVMRRINTH